MGTTGPRSLEGSEGFDCARESSIDLSLAILYQSNWAVEDNIEHAPGVQVRKYFGNVCRVRSR